MFIPDMPNVPPQDVPVMIAQAKQVLPGDTATIRTIGVCSPSPNQNYSAENGLAPLVPAGFYLEQYEHQTVTGQATTVILQQPKHGVLRLVTEADRGTLFDGSAGPMNPAAAAGFYVYLPEKGYLGKDSAALLVDVGGRKVKIVYFLEAIEGPLGNTGWEDRCSDKGLRWKISANPDTNGTITSVKHQSLTRVLLAIQTSTVQHDEN